MIDNNLEPIVTGYARARLSPTEAERAIISARYNALRQFLGGRTFQSGSYARLTSTTPVNDLDVIYVLPDEVVKILEERQATLDPSKLDIRQMIVSLAAELRKHYGSSARITPHPHSVGIFFGKETDFSIDVVPATPAEADKVWIPEIARSSIVARRDLYRSWELQERTQAPPDPNWIKSHPKGYIAQATTLDQNTSGTFRKTAKVMKKWRWSCKRTDDAFRLKSFHLELAVTRWFQRNPNARCVEAIRGVVGELDTLTVAPQFHDLADNRQFVDQYIATLTDSDRELLRKQFDRAQFLWAEVERAKSSDAVQRTLEAILGVTASLAAPHTDTTPKTIVAVAPKEEREGTEEFLSDYGIPYRPQYQVKVDGTVTRDGFRPFNLRRRAFPLLGKLRGLQFIIVYCDVPEPYEVRWKVKNTGAEATHKGALRGQIHEDTGQRRRKESTLYWGNHYVECYVIKNGVCVAADHLEVPIGPKE